MGFLKYISGWRLTQFLFLLRFVVLYFIQHVYHLFSQNIGKRRAVEPSDFWRIRNTFRKQSFPFVCLFFLSNFHILADLRILLVDRLGHVGCILDRFGCHFDCRKKKRKWLIWKDCLEWTAPISVYTFCSTFSFSHCWSHHSHEAFLLPLNRL